MRTLVALVGWVVVWSVLVAGGFLAWETLKGWIRKALGEREPSGATADADLAPGASSLSPSVRAGTLHQLYLDTAEEMRVFDQEQGT